MAALCGLPLLLLLLLVGDFCQPVSAQKDYGGSSWIAKCLGCCIYYPHNMEEYLNCCKVKETCGLGCDIWSPMGKGCHHKGEWFAIGAVIETNVKKCLQVKCCPYNGPGCPEPYAETQNISEKCNCCEDNGVLYEPGAVLHVGNCARWRCRRGEWLPINDGNVNRYKPCPPGSTQIRDQELCIAMEPLWLTWDNAVEFCRSKGGRLLSVPSEQPQIEEELQALLPCDGAWLNMRRMDTLCRGIPPGAQNASDLSCEMRLRPRCILPARNCNADSCTVGETEYGNDTIIETIDECIDIVCQNGYAITRIQESCCSAEASDGIDIVPSGATFETDGKACRCREGTVTCCLPGTTCSDIPDQDQPAK